MSRDDKILNISGVSSKDRVLNNKTDCDTENADNINIKNADNDNINNINDLTDNIDNTNNAKCKNCCLEKHTHRQEEQKKKLLNRLNRIEGQIRGIRAMVERDAYCNDILVQSAAVAAAINGFNKEVLANHINTCVIRDIRDGKEEVVDELVKTIYRLMK